MPADAALTVRLLAVRGSAVVAPWPLISLAGAGIGLLMGLFGVGGSSVATPLLSLLGVPGLAAVASPLPAIVPSAVTAAIPYLRAGDARSRAAGWTLLGAVPATVVGALLSQAAGGPALLVASGVVLVAVGVRVVLPIDDAARAVGTARRQNRRLLVAAAVAVGLFTGLLANPDCSVADVSGAAQVVELCDRLSIIGAVIVNALK